MIQFTDVVKTYQQGNNALNGATMQIEDGEFVFLIGPSGSGKSTPLPCTPLVRKPRRLWKLPMPCVVKTVDGGSSLGVFLPDTREELKDALLEVLKFGSRVLVEKRVYGRELVAGVLGENYLPCAMTIPANNGNFDYVSKYQSLENGGATELCPAPITQEEQKLVGELTLKLFHGLGLQVYARADVILDEEGNPWFLEFNSLPGMTPASFMPKEAAAAGITYNQLCEQIVQLSYSLKRRG